MQAQFDLAIGRLDRILSELVAYARSGQLDDQNKQTLKHCAEDMEAAAKHIFKKLGLVEGTTQPELQLESDAGFRARALHRIVRSMHDGHCPKCGYLIASSKFYINACYAVNNTEYYEGRHKCPQCGFTVLDSEAERALAEFNPYLQKSVAIFEEWRQRV